MSRAHLPLTLLCGSAFVALCSGQDLELEEQELRWRVIAEDFDPGNGDRLGAIGVHLDWLDAFDALPGSYVGIGGYGSVYGDRAGALHAGFTAGWRREMRPGWWLDVGLYGGVGGGDPGANGRGDWGSGLVVRPHVGLEHRFGSGLGLRLEYSRVDAPGGDVGSNQVAVGFTVPERLLRSSWAFSEIPAIELDQLIDGKGRIGLGAQLIVPSGGSRRRDGSPISQNIALTTGTVERSLGGPWYAKAELGMAAGGDVPGYVQALLGLGLRSPLVMDSVDWRAELLAGAAGGGRVDTGGGLLLGARAGIETSAGVDSDWRLRLTGGYAVAPDGAFDGFTLEAGVEWSPRPLEVAKKGDAEGRGLNSSDVELDSWQLQILGRSLALDSSAVTLGGERINDDIYLVGIGGVRQLSQRIELSLRAFGAFESSVGGYRQAELGARYDLDVLPQLPEFGTVYVQAHLGVGGGGDVDTGSGLFHTLGAGWHMVPRSGFQAGIEFDTLHALEGQFDAQTFAIVFGWDLTYPRRP